jgi:hypothetical protein
MMKTKEILNVQTLRDIRSEIIRRVIANNYPLDASEPSFFDGWTEEQYCGAISACRCFFRYFDSDKRADRCGNNTLITNTAHFIALYISTVDVEFSPGSIEAWSKELFLQDTEFLKEFSIESKEDMQKYWLLGDDALFAQGWLFTCFFIVMQTIPLEKYGKSNVPVLPIIVNYFYGLIENYAKNSTEELYEDTLFWEGIGLFIRLEVNYLSQELKDSLLELNCKEHFWREGGINDRIIEKWRKRFDCFQDKETAIQIIKSEHMCCYYD